MKDTVLEDTFLPGDEQPDIGDLVDLECQLCKNSTQHNCSICDQKICNLCCQQDPNSSNEMKRIHKFTDPRCTSRIFECASCDIKFTQQGQLVAHMESHDDSIQMKSLVSQADDSSWKYVICGECDGKFENEMDLEYHKERAHTYGEACTLYPCEECGYQGKDVTELKKHVDNYHPKNMYNKRIKQNLQNINLDDDSDDDWNPNQDDEALLAEESDLYIPKKRKLTEPEMPVLKKNKF